MTKRSAYAAECIDCIVRPCVQSPWYCLHSPINVFCMVWSCCHGDPRIGRLKRGNVCMEGVRGKRERSMSVDWRTDSRMAQCVFPLIDMPGLWDYWTFCLFESCNCFLFFLFCYSCCFFLPFVCLPLLPCHHICSSCCTGLEVLHPQWSFYIQLCLEVCILGLNSCHKLKMGEEIMALWMWFLFKSFKYEFLSCHLVGLQLGDEQQP